MKIQLTKGHPRLFLTPRELPRFKARAKGPLKAYRRMLLEKLEPFTVSQKELRDHVSSMPEYVALALGQAWRLTGDERYARAGHWLLQSLHFTAEVHPSGYDTWGLAAEAAALLYDWMHDYWKRACLEETAARAVLFCARRALEETLRFYIVDDWHNYSLGLQTGALAGALAVGLDHPRLEDGTLLRKLHALHFTGLWCDEFFIQDAYHPPPTVRCLDAALRSGGNAGFAAHAEATGAYHSVDGWELARIASYWDSAAPGAHGAGLLWPELDRLGEALLRFTRPDGRNLVLGDATPYASIRATRTANIMLHLHARKPNPVFAAYVRATGHMAEGPFPTHLLLRAQKDSTPVARERETFGSRQMKAWPTAALLDPVAVLRSSWEPDATLVAFRCGRHGGWHNHLDHNSFTIFRGGALAIDAGAIDYRSPHRPEYAMRTLAHNVILVRDPAEKRWLGKLAEPTGNDGGQRLVTVGYAPPNPVTGAPHPILSEERREAFADEFEMGRYLAFEPGAKADYLAGDATRAYTYPWSGLGDNPSRRVEEAVRQLVFLKPDLVVVFDRVEATRAHFEKTWLLHTMNAPLVCEKKKRRKAAAGLRALPADAAYEFKHEEGRLTVWPLLPAARSVRSVGGKGYESWVDHPADGSKGCNYPSPERSREAGAWRLEVRPERKALRDCFLTVLHAGLAKDRPAREVVRCAAHLEGDVAALSIFRYARRAWMPWASVRFRTQGPVEVEYCFQGEEARYASPAPERVPQARG
ncbi:MAG: heparinase II/III family protein [Planctomycetota bacterium]|nr:heparinase II/III family protein [Planctomycetota bacterium]